MGGTWVVRLAAALEVQLQWLQPLLTPSCYEAFTLTLLDKVVAMMEVLLGRKVRRCGLIPGIDGIITTFVHGMNANACGRDWGCALRAWQPAWIL